MNKAPEEMEPLTNLQRASVAISTGAFFALVYLAVTAWDATTT